MSTRNSQNLPTVKAYLAMQDWKFEPRIEEGRHGDYYWASFPWINDYEPFKQIAPPSTPFCTVVKPSKYDDLTAASIAQRAGWARYGDFAISKWSTTLPNIELDGISTRFFVDILKSDSKIIEAIGDFEFDYFLFLLPGQAERFWQTVDSLQPYCCVSGGTFVARGKDVYEQFYNQELLDEYERDQWQFAKKERARLWGNIGPERGPEVCVEPGCDRLKIELSIRCFVHHAWGLWAPGGPQGDDC